MLAYLITHYLQQVWADFDLMVKEGLNQLSMICSTEIVIRGQERCHRIPTPGDTAVKLLDAANIRLPKALPHLGGRVVSRKKLQTRRLTIGFCCGSASEHNALPVEHPLKGAKTFDPADGAEPMMTCLRFRRIQGGQCL